MQPILPVNQGKRRLIKRDAPESGSDSEQVPNVLPSERLVHVERSEPSSVKKARRGRPKKVHAQTAPIETSRTEISSATSVATVSNNNGSFQQIDEVVLALQDILKNKRPSTELAYRMPLAVWKVFI